jgi:hypothetical protein
MAVLTVKGVEAALRELHGNMAAVARRFGVVRTAVHNYVRRHPSLRAVVHDCREAMKDHAESALYSAVLRGEPWATCFFLKCQAKDRGYVERTEHRHGGDEAPPIALKQATVPVEQLPLELCERILQHLAPAALGTGTNGTPPSERMPPS